MRPRWVGVWTSALCWAALLIAAPPFQIVNTYLPLPQAAKPYLVQLRAVGGTPPYHWTVQGQGLPAWLALDASTGRLSGTPPSNQPFSVLIELSDSATPPRVITRLLPASRGAPVALAWSQPVIAASAVQGRLRVANHSGEPLRMTAIVTAVNQDGKAFALRYLNETLSPDAASPWVSYNVALPPGEYTVNFDAVGEALAGGAIFRNHQETAGLQVP